MVLVDANVLIYAVNEDAEQHAAAKSWMEATLGGVEPIGFAWVALLAFLRLTTRGAVMPSPLEPSEALDIVDDWLSAPPATVTAPTTRHLAILSSLINEVGTASNMVMDAHLAALAIEHGARLCTFDSDFRRFSGLEVESPS